MPLVSLIEDRDPSPPFSDDELADMSDSKRARAALTLSRRGSTSLAMDCVEARVEIHELKEQLKRAGEASKSLKKELSAAARRQRPPLRRR
ncbi:MAG: hypothetical protein LBR80_15800 [Deltaproteobacteria bacterium]|nr:hypothetical protein [Deltaproteobacteria bacterium]